MFRSEISSGTWEIFFPGKSIVRTSVSSGQIYFKKSGFPKKYVLPVKTSGESLYAKMP